MKETKTLSGDYQHEEKKKNLFGNVDSFRCLNNTTRIFSVLFSVARTFFLIDP